MRHPRGAGAAFVTLALLTTSAPARAFDGPGDTVALPCRPTIACTAEIVPPGVLELEAGALYRSLAASERQLSSPFLAKLTVAKWLQLQIGDNGYTSESGPMSARYLDNVTLGGKFHLVDQFGWKPAVSVSFTASLPTFAEVGYARDDALLMTAYVTKDFGPLHVDFNVGLNRFDVNTDPVSQAWVSLSLSTALPASFGLMVENYYFTPAVPAASRDGGGLIALSYTPVPWLVFDAGVDVGYVPSTRSFSAFGGVTVVPFRLWRAE